MKIEDLILQEEIERHLGPVANFKIREKYNSNKHRTLIELEKGNFKLEFRMYKESFYITVENSIADFGRVFLMTSRNNIYTEKRFKETTDKVKQNKALYVEMCELMRVLTDNFLNVSLPTAAQNIIDLCKLAGVNGEVIVHC